MLFNPLCYDPSSSSSTILGLIVSLALFRRQADALREQIILARKQMAIQQDQSRPSLVFTDMNATIKPKGEVQKVRFFARIVNNGTLAAENVIVHTKEVTSEKIKNLIKEKAQIFANSTELGTIVRGSPRDYPHLIDWMKGKETTLLALWFEYTFLDTEDENLVVVKVAGGWNQNDMTQWRYTHKQIKEAEASQGEP